MNQILITEKLYVTPELRRKKKLYKLQFFFCTFFACLLFSYYIYAEYDRNKSEEVSKEIMYGLSQLNTANENKLNNTTDTTVKKVDKIIVVALDDNTEISNQATITSKTVELDGVEYTVEGYVRVPRLDIDYPILADSSEELLKISINKYWGPNPNEVGNYCLVGHNYKSKKMFGRLSEMVSGDLIEIEDMSGKTITYSVYDKKVVEPTDTSCTSQLTNGRKEVTLITCTNYGQQRLVVKAREVK